MHALRQLAEISDDFSPLLWTSYFCLLNFRHHDENPDNIFPSGFLVWMFVENHWIKPVIGQNLLPWDNAPLLEHRVCLIVFSSRISHCRCVTRKNRNFPNVSMKRMQDWKSSVFYKLVNLSAFFLINRHMQKSVLPRHVSFSGPTSHFSIFASRKKPLNFTSENFVKSAKASSQNACTCAFFARKLLWGRPVFRSGAWKRTKRRKKDLIRFSFNGCSHTSATFFLAIFFFRTWSYKSVIFFARASVVCHLAIKKA